MRDFVAVDWGTSAFRAYAVTAGQITARIARPIGILQVAPGGHAAVLAEAAAALGRQSSATPDGPFVLSGMAGSRQGWREAPYVPCPADAAALAASAVTWDEPGLGRVLLVPGLMATDSLGLPDVMRGEETQILGAMAGLGTGDATIILPGTHSKHATVRAGRITGFATYMTGEAFAALKDHTILSRLMADGGAPPNDGPGFARGVAAGAAAGSPASLLHRIFAARTLGLTGDLPADQLAGFLSGVLIGAELAALPAHPGPVVLAGSPDLTTRYLDAAQVLGLSLVAAPPDCVVAGQMEVFRKHGI